jgi:cob(I)alamin adenosyltransferase
MSIYTRTGDSGTTALFGGKRVLKCEELVDVYGSIDELNSWVGLVATETAHEHIKLLLEEIQTDLFIIGGFLAGGKIDITPLDTRVPKMEVEIDAMEEELPKLSNFIIPGGTKEAAHVHIARSVCRRVERQAVALGQKEEKINPLIIKYLNRLSDLFFVLARFINMQSGISDSVWNSKK